MSGTMDMMTLRRAANLMRERASAAIPGGPWTADVLGSEGYAIKAPPINPDGMHPSIALAVADWLDATVAEHESDSGNERVDSFFMAFDTAPDLAALAVARTYLGETP